MPIHYGGTTGSKVLQQPVLQQLFDEANQLVNYATAHPNKDLMKEWFGKNFEPTRAQASEQAVAAGLAQIHAFLQQQFTFTSKNVNSFAFADQSNNHAEIFLGNWFSFNWFTWGERVVTMIHETSHKSLLKTKDIEYKGHPAYKYKCVDLANDTGTFSKALTNAENWAYYIASYYKLAGLAGGRANDWQYLIKSKMERASEPPNNQPNMVADDPAVRVVPAATWP